MVTVSPDKSNVILDMAAFDSLETTLKPVIERLRNEPDTQLLSTVTNLRTTLLALSSSLEARVYTVTQLDTQIFLSSDWWICLRVEHTY